MRKYDKQFIGFVFGIIGPVLGSFFYHELVSDLPYKEFIELIIETDSSAAVISLSAIFNLVVFFYFIWIKLNLAARGVILATFVYVLLVILLKFV